MSTNNAEEIRSVFAKNASQAYGDGLAKSGEAFFRWVDSDIIGRKGHVENPVLQAGENSVVVTDLYRSRGYSSQANFLFTVENGLLTSWLPG